jgi:hypothetical protein
MISKIRAMDAGPGLMAKEVGARTCPERAFLKKYFPL